MGTRGRPKNKAIAPKLTIQLSTERVERLRSLAQSLGFVVEFGSMQGKGNLSALMAALADVCDRNPEDAIALLKILLRSP